MPQFRHTQEMKMNLVALKPKEEHKTPWGKVWKRGADVLSTFKRYGFVPPTEYRNDYLFKVNREAK
jgi:hypothetical protein